MSKRIESFPVHDLIVPAFDMHYAMREHLQRNLGEEPGHQTLVDSFNDWNVDRVGTARQDGVGKSALLPLIASFKSKIGPSNHTCAGMRAPGTKPIIGGVKPRLLGTH
jgi:hypothetical protein